MKDECAACHAEHAGRDGELRPFDPKGFDHAKEAGFPLDGKHAPLAQKCASCHKTRSFLKLSPSCVTCHADSHKGALGASCITCHSAAVAFKETRQSFDHGKTKYPLTGAHVKVACAKCHANGVFRGVKFATCADCHKDPHQKAFGADCSSCHETATFRTVKVDHGKTAFPLRGRHAEIQCAACHKEPATKVKLKAGTCATCHQDPHRGEFKQDCASCHNEKSFRGVPFDHAVKTKFALTGKHATAKCAACHVPPGAAAAGANGKRSGGNGAAKANGSLPKVVVFKGLKTECAACHKDPHKGTLGTACGTCHGTESFRPKDFKHPRFPEFFAGLHENLACEKCHGGPKTGPNGKPVPVGERTYRGLSVACATCHKDPHLGQVSASCETCHAVTGAKFAPVKFDHAKSAFPLAGKHAPLACEKCHKKETAKFPAASGTAVRLKGLGTACATCHKDPHLGQLGTSCATCHSAETFKVPAFKHPGSPEFWKGAHATAPCAKCHKTEDGAFPAGKGTAVRYKGFKSSCASCHKDAHQGTLGPSCESCHAPSGEWKTASRAFHKTSWPLEGRHLLVPCASCHVKGQTKGTPRLCADCHWYRRQDDRFKTRLGLDCQNCHRPASWTAVTWSHAAATGFALSGAHAGVDCEKCHTGGVFRKSETSGCIGCHKEDYDRAKEPNHVTSGFPTTCETCHKVSDTSWEQARFNHQASFPLAGKHATAACASCHKNGVYRGTARDCSGCHISAVPEGDEPEPHPGGVPDDVRDVPQVLGPVVEGGLVQPREVAPRGTARDPGLHDVPPERSLPGARVDVRLVPPGRLPEGRQPEPRRRGLPDGVRDVPQGLRHVVAAGEVRPRDDLPPRREAHHAGLRRVSQERRLPRHGPRLRRVPPPAVPEGDEPEPHPGGIPDDVRDVPQGDGPVVDGGGVQSLRSGRSRESTRPRRARPATGAASSRGSRRRAPRATRPTTRRR